MANAPSIGEGTEASVCRVLSHDEARCVGCGTCAMMCALYHDGEVGPTLSRSRIVRDPFSYDFSFDVCQQCVYPECYFACPLMGKARKIDRRTGIVYADEEECIGCGSCFAACRFDPSRTTMHPEKRTLLQVNIEDAEDADDIFTTLMGEKVEPRRDFIQNHALEVKELDI